MLIVLYLESTVVDICALCAEAMAGKLSQVWYFKLNFMSRVDETCKKHWFEPFELIIKPILNYNHVITILFKPKCRYNTCC